MRVLEKTHPTTFDSREIMGTLMRILLLFAVSFQLAISGSIDVAEEDRQGRNISWENSSAEVEKSVEDKMKELRIEMVKFQILSKLNLKEPPPPVPPPSESSKETIKLLLSESEEHPQQQGHRYALDSKERLIIHSVNDGSECFHSNDGSCKIFQFELSTSLNTSSMDIWVFRTEDSFSKILSLKVSYTSSDDEKLLDKVFSKVHKAGWNKIELPRISLPSSWNDSFVCTVEVSGENIETYGDHRAFLMISKSSYIASRQRRDISCDSQNSCCLKPLKVCFADIGFNWVLYPVELEANMCSGKCLMDHGAMRTHYERAMTEILEKDSTLQESLGECWKLCCKPKQLAAVRVIYNDSEGIIHDQYIPELSVTSCSCS